MIVAVEGLFVELYSKHDAGVAECAAVKLVAAPYEFAYPIAFAVKMTFLDCEGAKLCCGAGLVGKIRGFVVGIGPAQKPCGEADAGDEIFIGACLIDEGSAALIKHIRIVVECSARAHIASELIPFAVDGSEVEGDVELLPLHILQLLPQQWQHRCVLQEQLEQLCLCL